MAPKDYVLYAVKFINPWHGNYLRRGVDQITEDGGATSTNVRRTAHVESDQLNLLTSAGLTTLNFPVSIANADGGTTTCNLLLSFGESGTCTITTTTDGMTASGTGKFVVDGEKLAWGNKDRDALYLDYTVDFGDREYVTRDTLVARDRGILMGAQQFAVTYVNE